MSKQTPDRAPGEVAYALGVTITRRLEEQGLLRVSGSRGEIPECRRIVADAMHELWPQITAGVEDQARALRRQQQRRERDQQRWDAEAERLRRRKDT